MANNGGQRKEASAKATPSSRLAVGAEDEWRSWNELPAGASDDDDENDDDEPITPSHRDTNAGLNGSMLVVGGADADSGATSEIPVTSSNNAELEAVAKAKAEKEALARALAEAEARAHTAAQAEAAALAAAKTQAAAAAKAEAEAAAAKRAAEAAKRAEAEAAKRAEEEAAKRAEEEAAKRAEAEAARRAEAEAAKRAEAEAARRAEAEVAQRAAAKKVPQQPADGDADRRPDVAFLLDSDPDVARRPHESASVGDVVSLGRLVAEAVDLLEQRVVDHERSTGSMLAELAAASGHHLPPFDRPGAESTAGGGIPKQFEDRVQSAFMSLVERIDGLEKKVESTPTGARDDAGGATSAAPGHVLVDEDAMQELAQQQATLAARFEDLHRTHQRVSEQQAELAGADRALAETGERTAARFEQVMGTLKDLSERVDQTIRVVPIMEQRIVTLEAQVMSDIGELGKRVQLLIEHFPVVQGSVDDAVARVQHNTDALTQLQTVVSSFGARLDADVTEIRAQLGQVSEIGEGLNKVRHLSESTHTEFRRLQAEMDRHTDGIESRLVELEDIVGNEAGVDRQLLLDRMEDMERGLVELDPDNFVRRDELPDLSDRPNTTPPSTQRPEA